MKLIFDNIVFSLQRSGGISVYWSELIGRFSKLNDDCRFLEYPTASQNISRAGLNLPDKQVVKLTSRIPLQLARYTPAPVDENLPCIFHSSYYRNPSGGKDIRKVVTVHDFTYERFKKGLRKKVHIWQKARAIAAADTVICVSENTRQDLITYYPEFKSKDLRVIYNGVSKDFFPLTGEQRISGAERPFILFIGSRAGYKNFGFAVQLVSSIIEYDLVVVGQPFTANEVQLLENSMKGRFRLYTALSNSELNGMYNRAFCLIYPSSYEGFGIPVIEAMRAGCPVIALNTSSLPEVCGDAGIMADALDIGRFKEAFKHIEDSRAVIVENGLRQASLFSWDKCFEETLSVYKQLGFDQ